LIGVDYFADAVSAGNGNAATISLSPLADFPHLTYLDMDGAVTDGDWEPLSRLKQLRDLHLQGPNITDETLAHVQGLTRLKVVYIGSWTSGDPQVTDDGLAYLKHLTSLEMLYLQDCRQVTDAGLQHLAGLAHLQSINMSHTKCTRAGFRQLRWKLPYLRIVGP